MKKFKRPEGRRPPRPQGRPQAPIRDHTPPEGRPVIGIHAVAELLAVRPRGISKFWLREKYSDHPGLQALADTAERLKVPIKMHPPGVLDKVTSNHQGVIAFTPEEPEVDWQQLQKAEVATLLALDEVEDPHNLGAVLRTAWLFGAAAVLTPEHRAAQLSPAVSKVAQGAVEHVPVVRDSALPQQLEALKKHGFWVLGLSHRATQTLYKLDIPKKVIWVLGSESSGLRKSVEGACDDLVAIPQLSPNASYNVSVAAAVALSETHRQRSLHIDG